MRRAVELAVGPFLLVIAAGALGSLALFAIAVGLGLVYVGMHLAMHTAASRVLIVRRVEHTEIVEGLPVTVHFDVSGLRGLPVQLERLCACGEWHLLPPGQSSYRYAIDRPGRFVFGYSPVRLRDDLGLLSRTMLAGAAVELLVLPAPAAVPEQPRRAARDASHDPEPDGLRPYVPGTPMSRIHWRSAARGGELQERVFSSAHDELPLVVVDTIGAPAGPAVDWAARTAAGHVLQLARDGGCRVLLPGDRTPTTLMNAATGWAAVHRRLALLEDAPAGRLALKAGTRTAVHVRAALAPPEAVASRGPLPPGIIAAADVPPLGRPAPEAGPQASPHPAASAQPSVAA